MIRKKDKKDTAKVQYNHLAVKKVPPWENFQEIIIIPQYL